MKRLSLALAATSLLAMPLVACTEEDPYEGEIVKDQDGKADTSAAALFVDFEFDGQLLTDSSWNTKNTIDDQLVAQPAGFDARSWVAVEAPLGAHKGWTGHAFLFAAQMHRCIVVHFTTEIARESERDALMARLLLVQTKLFPRLTVDAARTAADAPIPRANEKR